MPKPPALLTAATSCGVETPAIGDRTMGLCSPRRSKKHVVLHMSRSSSSRNAYGTHNGTQELGQYMHKRSDLRKKEGTAFQGVGPLLRRGLLRCWQE